MPVPTGAVGVLVKEMKVTLLIDAMRGTGTLFVRQAHAEGARQAVDGALEADTRASRACREVARSPHPAVAMIGW
jgi:hypothetical protein